MRLFQGRLKWEKLDGGPAGPEIRFTFDAPEGGVKSGRLPLKGLNPKVVIAKYATTVASDRPMSTLVGVKNLRNGQKLFKTLTTKPKRAVPQVKELRQRARRGDLDAIDTLWVAGELYERWKDNFGPVNPLMLGQGQKPCPRRRRRRRRARRRALRPDPRITALQELRTGPTVSNPSRGSGQGPDLEESLSGFDLGDIAKGAGNVFNALTPALAQMPIVGPGIKAANQLMKAATGPKPKKAVKARAKIAQLRLEAAAQNPKAQKAMANLQTVNRTAKKLETQARRRKRRRRRRRRERRYGPFGLKQVFCPTAEPA